jgi:hypothetical protein
MADETAELCEAYGYDLVNTVRPWSMHVADGKDPETLAPCLLLHLELVCGEPPTIVALDLEAGEALAVELVQMAALARAKSL